MRSEGTKIKGSMTVEASIVLPLFIIFFVNILTLFNIVKVSSDMTAALHQTGSEMSQMAFDLRFSKGQDSAGVLDGIAGAAGVFYAKAMVREQLGAELDKSCVNGGYDGVSYLMSRVLLGNDIIDLVADYRVHPLIPIIGFKEFKVRSRYYGHAWTGYDISNGLGADETEEELVYVTQYGEVYHRSIDCSYLKIKVRSVDKNDLVHLRNESGGKYYPCELCGSRAGAGNVFITEYGDKYHASAGCSALTRKIYTIRLSEAGGRRACSHCG